MEPGPSERGPPRIFLVGLRPTGRRGRVTRYRRDQGRPVNSSTAPAPSATTRRMGFWPSPKSICERGLRTSGSRAFSTRSSCEGAAAYREASCAARAPTSPSIARRSPQCRSLPFECVTLPLGFVGSESFLTVSEAAATKRIQHRCQLREVAA